MFRDAFCGEECQAQSADTCQIGVLPERWPAADAQAEQQMYGAIEAICPFLAARWARRMPAYARVRTEPEDRWSAEVELTRVAYRLSHGPAPLEALARFTGATGRQPEPARWFFKPWYQTGHANHVPLEEERRQLTLLRTAAPSYRRPRSTAGTSRSARTAVTSRRKLHAPRFPRLGPRRHSLKIINAGVYKRRVRSSRVWARRPGGYCIRLSRVSISAVSWPRLWLVTTADTAASFGIYGDDILIDPVTASFVALWRGTRQ
jgi:hypothetical protein